MFWLLVFVPVVLVLHKVRPEAHTALFLLSVVAIIPLAALLSHATESVAAKTGDAVGGLLNATLGNLTELVIVLTALRAGMMDLVKGSLTGAIVTNSLFMLGGCFFLGGLRHRVQEFNPRNARVQAGMLLLASIALLVPSIVNRVEAWDPAVTQPLSLSISVILLVTYALSALFSLKTHKEFFGSAAGGEDHGTPWPMGLALGALAGSTVFIAVVSEIFVESVQHAAVSFGMSKAFVGFVIVSIVGAAAEMMSAFSAARKNRLDMSVGIAMGSSTQIAMFVAPVLVILSYFIAPAPMDLQFGGGQVIMVLLATLTVSSVVSGGQSAWYSGVQLIAVYAIFAVTLYMIPG
ncbi:MAG TPA: calcium/proton exchanger [Thermoanaerobaculia bacterium]